MVANIFFYRKGDTTIMIDAGYNHDQLAEKMNGLGIINHPALLASEMEHFLADGDTVADAQQNQESEIQ